MPMRKSSLFVTTLLLTPTLLAAQSRTAAERAPRSLEPNRVYPAAMAEITIPSGGVRLNALAYLAAGAGPHPVVVFLHGFPGNERNLDLAQAVRRAGYSAIYFNYRGSWGTGGTFSMQNSLDDVAAVLAWVRDPGIAAEHRLDPSRIAVVGHSFGGMLALTSVEQEPVEVCVAALAAANLGWLAGQLSERPMDRAGLAEALRATTDPISGPVRASAEDLVGEMTEHAHRLDYLQQAPALKNRALLLAAATRDNLFAGVEMHSRLAHAIAAAGGRAARTITYEDDHSFSTHRQELAEALVNWLETDCSARQSPVRRIDRE